MDGSVVEALIQSRTLDVEGLRGLIATLAAAFPDRLPALADRPDLDPGTRADLVRAVQRYQVVPILERWPADIGLVEAAEAAHGSGSELVVYCAAQGWLKTARSMAARLRPEDVDFVPRLWERKIGAAIPDEVRLALLDALMAEPDRQVDLAAMSTHERGQVMERVREEEERRAQAVWELLEPVPHLWAELARESPHGNAVSSVLLDRPDELSDDVLIACLPAVTADDVRAAFGEKHSRLRSEIRLGMAADFVRRRPRLRVIAADELRRVVREAVDDGWTPRDRLLGVNWSGIADLAALTDEPALLSEAAGSAAAEPERRDELHARYHRPASDRRVQRTDAILALVANRATPRADLVALLPTLDEPTLIRILDQADGEFADACRARIERLHQEAAARQPKRIAVPSDEELARTADPVKALSGHLRYLRWPAAQRDLTAEGLLRSRYTTRDLLELIPARHVLAHADRADQIAEMIIEVCGNDLGRWQTLAAVAGRNPTASMTFKTWLVQLADPDQPR